MIGLAVGSPFDFIKVRMQNSASEIKIIPTILQTYRNEGLAAFYKGLLPPLLGEGLINSVWFGTYAAVSALLQTDRTKDLTFIQGCIGGAASGVTGSFVYGPVDLIKVRVQMSTERGSARKKPLQIISQIYKAEGIKGFTRGLWPTIIREVPSTSVYFGFYNFLKTSITAKLGSFPAIAQIVSGGTAGALSWAAIYPVDVIKTRMQTTSQFSSTAQCVRHVWHNEGLPAFFKGLTPCLVRSFPVNATVFWVYEFLISWTL
uniref:Mitochondrial carrier protein n=1 Tax=Arcella intermedia TaxID=1963864 RepID=A0A6B2LDL2_9EUKA